MMDYILLIWLICIIFNTCLCIYVYWQIVLYSKDQVDAVKLTLELLKKEFQFNTDQHKEMIDFQNENNQKIIDQIIETKKNIFNLAIFMGYRPKNLDDF